MSDKTEQRQRRAREYDDDGGDRGDRYDRHSNRRRQPRPETKFVFRVNGKPKPPEEIRFDREPKLGDTLSTSEGPHRVVEVYWSGGDRRGWKADVLLKPLGKKDKPKDKSKDGAAKKHASHNAARKPASKRPSDRAKTRKYAKAYGG